VRRGWKIFSAMPFFCRKRVAQIQQICTTTNKWDLNPIWFHLFVCLKECLISYNDIP
jgi:hypothetical protein